MVKRDRFYEGGCGLVETHCLSFFLSLVNFYPVLDQYNSSKKSTDHFSPFFCFCGEALEARGNHATFSPVISLRTTQIACSSHQDMPLEKKELVLSSVPFLLLSRA